MSRMLSHGQLWALSSGVSLIGFVASFAAGDVVTVTLNLFFFFVNVTFWWAYA